MASGKEIGKAVYSIFTSPHHQPQKDHLPTLMVTPAGRPQHILYIYMHTNYNQENYLLTPTPEGSDLCVAKLFPPHPESMSSSSSSGHGHNSSKAVKCEASRNLKWSIVNTGVAMPTYKLTLPNPDGGEDQPLIQISKTNKNSPYWLMTYYTYAGHLIPPARVEFGRIEKSDVARGGDGGTRVIITGKTDEQKAVWKTLGEGNEDMVEWCVLCGALNVIDDEVREAARNAGHPIRAPPPLSHQPREARRPSQPDARDLHPTGRSLNGALSGLSLGAPQVNGAPPPQRPQPQKSRSYEASQPPSNPAYIDTRQQAPPASMRAPSPYGRPPPSLSSARPPMGDRAPTGSDPQRPYRGGPPPTMARNEPPQPFPSGSGPRPRGISEDPRLYGSPGGAPPQRDPREVRSFGPGSRERFESPRPEPSMRDPSPSFGRPPPMDGQSRQMQPPAPPGLYKPSSTPSLRPSSDGMSRGPMPQPPRERTMDSSRSHGRTSSLDIARSDLRTMRSVPSPSPSSGSQAPDHRRAPGREPTGYQPGQQRRFDKPMSPTMPSPPHVESQPPRGVQLQDVPASRSMPASSPSLAPSAGPTAREDGHSTAMSAAERIKQQRLARTRQAADDTK